MIAKNASQATEEANKLNGEYHKLKEIYGNKVKRLEVSRRADADYATSEHDSKRARRADAD
jgi:hypothetical protein